MVILICIVIFIACLWSACSDADAQDLREWQYEVDERRHQELLEATRRKSNPPSVHKRTRTVARDEYGRTVMQEIEEGDYDE